MSQIEEVFPYLRVRGAAAAIEFYAQAFGALEQFRLTEPSGRIGHAQITVGPTTIMLSDEFPEYGIFAPTGEGKAAMILHIHCSDVDQLLARAVKAGATVTRPLTDQFYGERTAAVRDPFGHEWLLGSPIEALTPEEMQRRYTALLSK